MTDPHVGPTVRAPLEAVPDAVAEVRDLSSSGARGVTVMEAAEAWQVDRSTIMRIRTVAKEGALEALASSRPGKRAAARPRRLTYHRQQRHDTPHRRPGDVG